jgi:organic radical activating enzyme
MKPRLKYAEVYITNVCNYSCSHCQSLNNFAFKGHQRWEDHENEYRSLSAQLDIDQIQIIGGEPMLNPDFENWLFGISNLWPKSKLQIATNGTRLDKITNEIYHVLLKHQGTLWITCHDIELYDGFLDFSKTFLNKIVSDTVADNVSNYDWKSEYERSKTDPTVKLKTVSRKLIDENGVEVILDWSQSFVSSIVNLLDDQSLTMKYNSDPVQAHDICYFKNCHQINKGKVYKCPLVSVLPDFLDQFDVTMSDDDRVLAQSYDPLTVDKNVSEFVNAITDPIPQCKFCPSNYTKHNFVGTEKKIKIVPRNQVIQSPSVSASSRSL